MHVDIDRDLLCANLQPRCEVLEDIPPQLDFFDAVLPHDAELYRNKKQKTTPETAREALAALLPAAGAGQADWNRDAIFAACRDKAAGLGVKNGWLLYPLGIALSGKSRTPRRRHRSGRHAGPRGDAEAPAHCAGAAGLIPLFAKTESSCPGRGEPQGFPRPVFVGARQGFAAFCGLCRQLAAHAAAA